MFWLNYFVSIVVVGVVLIALTLIARGVSRHRLLRGPGDRTVNVLESTSITSSAAIHVIAIGSRRLAIGVSHETIAVLTDVPEVSYPCSEKIADNFIAVLAQD